VAENIQKVYKNKFKTSLGWYSKETPRNRDKENLKPL
jgi:predicted phosphoadenosine phosphosulfate sulfurtransferase